MPLASSTGVFTVPAVCRRGISYSQSEKFTVFLGCIPWIGEAESQWMDANLSLLKFSIFETAPLIRIM